MNMTQTITKLTELADALGRGGLSLGFTAMHGKTVLDEAELRAMAAAIAKGRDELSSMRESAQSADLPQPASDGPLLASTQDRPIPYGYCDRCGSEVYGNTCPPCQACGGHITAV